MRCDFTGKTAVVTGGASGIGLAAARLLAKSGAMVYIFDRKSEPPVDVTDPDAVQRSFAAVPEPDVVVINAGVGEQSPLGSTSRELWDRTIAINLSGAFHCLQQASQRMKPRRKGSIVLTASTNSFDGEADLTAYNASKAGVLGLLHTAANELGPYGIRVNAVCPGLIRTPLTQGHFTQPAVLKDYFRHIPLGRGGEADEVAQAIAFLASDQASYITGASLLVDGGQMAAKFGTWNEESAVFQGDRWQLK
jgi:NAD(P)-dependent dehydrogenase (short-subunit alcohol dehydrogenase family)